MSVDVVVSIDLGMTSTGNRNDLKTRISINQVLGVAYTRRPHKTIHRLDWAEEAGKATFKATTKIPTVLRYEACSSPSGGHLTSWGFQASEGSDTVIEGEHSKIVEWFKPYLNSDYLQAASLVTAAYLPKSDSEVRRWYIDYLRKLHDKVQVEILKGQVELSWDTMRIEFRFTWPTTWTAADVESFRECIIAAGYQNDQRSHLVNLSTNEAQAAALYAAGQIAEKVKDGESVMVCDVGGGTVDIAVVRAVADANDPIRFELEWNCQGKATGATDIDVAFQDFVKQRLSLIQDLQFDAAKISRDLRESYAWYTFKRYGDGSESTKFPLKRLIDSEAAGIREGWLELTREDLRDIFHETIARVQRAVLKAMQAYKKPLASTARRCGGYFRMAQARNAFTEMLPSAAQYLNHCSKTKIHIAQDPELAVSNGGCLRLRRRPVFEDYSLGLVCGERVYDLASTSSLSWIGDNSETRSRTDVYPLKGDARNPLSVNISFDHYPAEGGYYYLTLVLLALNQHHDRFEGSDDGEQRVLCQVRLQKRYLASRWAFMGAAECKPLTLTWKTGNRRLDLEIRLVESKIKIPFEMCEPDISPLVEVCVPPHTKRIGKAQWK
ncbi:MAG: hypothetical protein Q9187_005429 [Circinaria calcarea]